MTMFYYIGANYPLPTGNYGEKYTLKKLKDIPKPSDPNDLRNIMDLSHLENEWTKVYETELDFAFVTIMEIRDADLKEELPMNKAYIYELGGSFHLNEADKTNHFSSYQANEKCVKELLSYVERELIEGETIEVYSCWADEEDLPIREEETINLSSFNLGKTFEIGERKLIRFVLEL
jgi:hypothetical protein